MKRSSAWGGAFKKHEGGDFSFEFLCVFIFWLVPLQKTCKQSAIHKNIHNFHVSSCEKIDIFVSLYSKKTSSTSLDRIQKNAEFTSALFGKKYLE